MCLQVSNFTSLLQLVNEFEQTCQFHQVATSLLKPGLLQFVNCRTCYNLLKQLAASLWITSFYNQLATSLLTTCNRLVVNKLSHALQTHLDISLFITSLLQDANRLAALCSFSSMQRRHLKVFHWIRLSCVPRN